MLDKKTLSFIEFILYKLSEKWDKAPSYVYQKLNSVNIIDDYLIPCYDTLHSLGAEYLVEDITDLLYERGGVI